RQRLSPEVACAKRGVVRRGAWTFPVCVWGLGRGARRGRSLPVSRRAPRVPRPGGRARDLPEEGPLPVRILWVWAAGAGPSSSPPCHKKRPQKKDAGGGVLFLWHSSPPVPLLLVAGRLRSALRAVT